MSKQTLWLFGDSYITTSFFPNVRWKWINQLSFATRSTVNDHAIAGSSLDYTFYQFDRAYDKFQEEDLIIITLTSLNRRYFILERPELASLFNIDCEMIDRRFDSKQADAVKKYFLYLHNEEAFKVDVTNFLYRVNHIARHLKQKVVVFKCFEDLDHIDQYADQWDNIHIARGNFFKDVTKIEGIHYDLPRPNHMCQSNHTILTLKIRDYYQNATPIDLTNNFVQVFNDGNIQNACLQIKELGLRL